MMWFLFYLAGASIAFIYYMSRGGLEFDYQEYCYVWVDKYTLKQQVTFSLTWFIWFFRGLVRWLLIACRGTILYIRDMSAHVWDKWRNE